MSWHDRLKTASFRGFEFKVLAAEVELGRRTVDHEYPGRDLSDVEDQGQRSRLFRVVAFVVGPDHDLLAGQFQDLIEAGTAGDLVHPWMGRHLVKPIDAHRLESGRDLNTTVFEVRFQQVSAQRAGPPSDPAFELGQAAARARAAAGGELAAGAVDSGVPSWVVAGLQSGLSVLSKTLGALHFAQDLASDVSLFARALNVLVNNAVSLLLAPAELAEAVLTAVDSINATAANGVGAFYAYQVLFDLAVGRVPGTSALAEQANRNQDLVLLAARTAAVYGACGAVRRGEWPSEEALAEAEEAVLLAVDALEEDAGDDLFQELERLRAAFVDALAAQGPLVETRRTVTLPRSRPALVVAYSVFDDVARDVDVLLASQCRDPLFVPAGRPFSLKVS